MAGEIDEETFALHRYLGLLEAGQYDRGRAQLQADLAKALRFNLLRPPPRLTLLTDTGDGGPVRGMIQLRSSNTFFVSSGNCWLINTGSSSLLGSIDPTGPLTLATDA